MITYTYVHVEHVRPDQYRVREVTAEIPSREIWSRCTEQNDDNFIFALPINCSSLKWKYQYVK